jgi:hypothetical protein
LRCWIALIECRGMVVFDSDLGPCPQIEASCPQIDSFEDKSRRCENVLSFYQTSSVLDRLGIVRNSTLTCLLDCWCHHLDFKQKSLPLFPDVEEYAKLLMANKINQNIILFYDVFHFLIFFLYHFAIFGPPWRKF